VADPSMFARQWADLVSSDTARVEGSNESDLTALVLRLDLQLGERSLDSILQALCG